MLLKLIHVTANEMIDKSSRELLLLSIANSYAERFWKGYIPTAELLCNLQGLMWIGHTLARLRLSVMMFPSRHKML